MKDVSTLRLALLGLIAREPCSAYDVRKVFEATPMGHFSASPGAIYPALKRLEDNGWISGRAAKAKTLRPKRVYRLTTKGRQALTKRLSQEITHDDVTRNLDDVILRFAFMDKLLDREQIADLLNQLRSEMESCLSSLQELLESIRNELSFCDELSMKHGIAKARMNIAWAKRAIEMLQND